MKSAEYQQRETPAVEGQTKVLLLGGHSAEALDASGHTEATKISHSSWCNY